MQVIEDLDEVAQSTLEESSEDEYLDDDELDNLSPALFHVEGLGLFKKILFDIARNYETVFPII